MKMQKTPNKTTVILLQDMPNYAVQKLTCLFLTYTVSVSVLDTQTLYPMLQVRTAWRF
jgi:hypothetical protein